MASNKNSKRKRAFPKRFLTLAIAMVASGILLTAHSPLLTVQASDPGKGDWPMWGGTPDRNMISNMKGLPISWDVKTKKNVKWTAQLGSQTYGNVVVAGGIGDGRLVEIGVE